MESELDPAVGTAFDGATFDGAVLMAVGTAFDASFDDGTTPASGFSLVISSLTSIKLSVDKIRCLVIRQSPCSTAPDEGFGVSVSDPAADDGLGEVSYVAGCCAC